MPKDVSSIRGRLDQCILEKHMSHDNKVSPSINQANFDTSRSVALAAGVYGRCIAPSPESAAPVPPFCYGGGDLGLNSDNGLEPWIYFFDHHGEQWLTHSVEFVLRRIHHFEDSRRGRRDQLLAAAAVHYGMDAWALIKDYDFKPRELDTSMPAHFPCGEEEATSACPFL